MSRMKDTYQYMIDREGFSERLPRGELATPKAASKHIQRLGNASEVTDGPLGSPFKKLRRF